VHRRRASMVGEAGNGDLEPAEPDDPLHHADLKPRLLEQAALLDVQLHVAREVTLLADRFVQQLDVSADDPDPLANRLAGARNLVEIGGRDVADRAPAPNRAAFLIRPDDDVEWVTKAHILLAE